MKEIGPGRTIWMGVLLGLLIITAPNWLLSGQHHPSSYDAPWVYPGDLAQR
jgi:hypothetical protein